MKTSHPPKTVFMVPTLSVRSVPPALKRPSGGTHIAVELMHEHPSALLSREVDCVHRCGSGCRMVSITQTL
jgi:hypothetical protein